MNDTRSHGFSIPDAHCHLEGVADPAACVAEAQECGVGPILAVGMRAASSEKALALRAQFPGHVLAGVGLHPSEIPALDDAALARELAFVEGSLANADVLGEVGLDFKDATDAVQQERQRHALAAQLGWAERARKPVNVHCRRADREIATTMAEFAHRTGLGVVLHWFTHSAKLVRSCAEAGVYVSAGPSILHDPLQAQVAVAIDPDLLLVETDTPVEYAGWTARPAWAVRVALQLAIVRGEPFTVLAERLTRNFERYRTAGARDVGSTRS